MRIFRNIRFALLASVWIFPIVGGADLRVVGSDLPGLEFTRAFYEFAGRKGVGLALAFDGSRAGLDALNAGRADLALITLPPAELKSLAAHRVLPLGYRGDSGRGTVRSTARAGARAGGTEVTVRLRLPHPVPASRPITMKLLPSSLRFPVALVTMFLARSAQLVHAAETPNAPADNRAGKNFIATRVFTAEEDARVLKAFEGLRVADVTDGMDFVGRKNIGLMDPEIRPLWKDTKTYKHRFIGIAVTVRYVPTQRAAPPAGLTYEEFRARESRWYGELSSEPFAPLIRPGTAIVIDEAPNADVGSIGSNNIMSWKLRGAVGVVTGATARDTDEVTTEEMPLYLRKVGRGIRPWRNEVESVNRPVVVGGVLVNPGDVIVADGDGVLVVPREVALQVAGFAQKIIEGDKVGRRALYKKLGLPDDPSVK